MTNVQQFKSDIAKKLTEELGVKNPMAVPVLEKIVVNIGVKNAVADKKNMEIAAQIMEQITGQKPKVTTAKKSIASFKLREGDKIGLMVTLRGKRMYGFFSKLVNVVLPRMKDFRGIKNDSFDSRGNYTLGLAEYSVFPEVDSGKVDRIQGLEICIVTKAKDKKEGFALLKTLGMPFVK
ncbi:MAG: 50S ribosomal protein L5 [Candidatus Levyibacteriota bacterium]